MTTWYVDPSLSANAGNGSSWALAVYRPQEIAAASLSDGDVIRVKKSPDPTLLGTGSFTRGSNTITLDASPTLDINTCESAWTAVGSCTTTTSSNRRIGSYSSSLTIPTSIGTGVQLCKYILGADLDLSSYQQVCFSIQASAAIASAGDLQLRLYSDSSASVLVATFSIPNVPYINNWQAVVLDTGAALPSVVRSMALYQSVARGSSTTVLIDNIFAAKASSEADSVTLHSLVSRGGEAYRGDYPWYTILGVSGTTLLLDAGSMAYGITSSYNKGCSEDTASSVNIYKREPFTTTPIGSSSTTVWTLTKFGTYSTGGSITLSGGWNSSTDTQDGDTFICGTNQGGVGLMIGATGSTNGPTGVNCMVERISPVRYYTGIQLAAIGHTLTLGTIVHCSTPIYGGLGNITADIKSVSGNYYGISTALHTSKYIIYNSVGNFGNVTVQGIGNRLFITNYKNSGNIVFQGENNIIYGMTMDAYCSYSFNYGASGSYWGTNYLVNCVIDMPVEYNGWTNGTYIDNYLFSFRHDNTDNYHKYFGGGHGSGVIGETQTSVRHTASGYAWKLTMAANRPSMFPWRFPLGTIAVSAGTQVTATVYLQRSNTGIIAKLVAPAGQLPGVGDPSADVVSDVFAGGAGSWDACTLTFTPTYTGALNLELQIYGTCSGYSLYVDDFAVTQA